MAQYLDEDGDPVGVGYDVNPPKGYSLLTSKKRPAAPNKKASVKELKILAAAKKPIVPPKGYIPEASVSAYTPSVFEQARSAVANSAIGYSLEQALPSIATALHLHPTEKMGTPQAEQHKNQLLSPEYLAPALTEAIRTGPLMQAPAPKEGRAPDATSNRIEGALRASGGLTTPGNMSLMAVTGAAGAGIGEISPAVANVLGRMASGGFTLQMLKGLYDQHKEYRKAVDAGNINEAQKIQGEMGVTGIIALLSGKHALTNHPFTPIKPKDIPVRERTNVIHRNTAGEVRQAKGQAPSVWLSPDAWQSFMGSLYPGEDAAVTHGVNLPANADLHSFAHDPQLAASHPAFGDVQQLLAKAHENASGGGIAISNTRPSIQSNVNVMREELNHTWQRGLSETGNFSNHLKPEAFTDLHQSIPKGMNEHLLDQGYDGTSAPEMVTEAAVKLMDGRPERFGTTPDEAVDFLDKYFKHVSDQHGTGALEELQHVRGIAADAKERAIAEHSRTGTGQDGGTVSGVANGGQGGTSQGLQSKEGGLNGITGQSVQSAAPAPLPAQEAESPRSEVGQDGSGGVSGVAGGGQGSVASVASGANAPASSGGEVTATTNAGLDKGVVNQSGSSVPTSIPGATGAPEDTLFNREAERPTWYLKSERLIGDKMKGPQAAEDVHKMLISGGVKPEEMQWTGLDDFLKSKGKDKVTPEEIREHLANNNIQIKEVMKPEARPVEWKTYPGGIMYTPDGYNIERMPTNGRYRLSTPAGMVESFGTLDEAKAEVDKYRSNTRADTEPTKYSQYQLPGGNNYREMLLTMPSKAIPAPKIDFKKVTEYQGEPVYEASLPAGGKATIHHNSGFPWRIDYPKGESDGGFDTAEAAMDAVQRNQRYNPVPKSPDFQSAHWDEPNILAHVRYNDRVGSNGEKLLHVEEAQSDWMQRGRDKGFHVTPKQIEEAKKNRADHNALQTRLAEKYGTIAYGNMITPEELAELKASGKKLDYETEAGKNPAGSVPDAPFKKTWHEMALRRMLKHAVEKNYDGLSWTPGADQNARYSLSNHVDELQYRRNDNGTYDIHGVKDGASVVSKKGLTDTELSDNIGKDAASRIVEQSKPQDAKALGYTAKPSEYGYDIYDPDGKRVASEVDAKSPDAALEKQSKYMNTGTNQGKLEGAGLEVGGSGMKGFYDKIVPEYLNKFGKKFGAKVSETSIDTSGGVKGSSDFWGEVRRTYDKHYSHGVDAYARFDKDGEFIGLSSDSDPDWNDPEGTKYIKVVDNKGNLLKDAPIPAGKDSKTVQYLPITPEMRKSVAEEGVPLFNREQVKTPEFKEWFGNSKIVDEKGDPQVLYHGTSIPSDEDITEFDPSQRGKLTGPKAKLGFYFTKDWNDAHFYSSLSLNRRGGEWTDYKPIQIPVYAKVENPLYVPTRKEFQSLEGSLSEADLKRQGYDGIVVQNGVEVIAFDPNQIKSADRNSGAFDPKDPNILRNRENSPDAAQVSPQDDQTLEENTNARGDAENPPEQPTGEEVAPLEVPTTIPIQGGTMLASAPKQDRPDEKVHTTAHHQTTTNVSVPLQTAMDITPVVTKRILPLSQVMAMAAAQNPSHQIGNVRDLMKEAKRRDPTKIVP